MFLYLGNFAPLPDYIGDTADHKSALLACRLQ